MTDSEKLARWQGYSLVKGRYHEGYDLFTGSLDDGTYQIVGKCFDYPNDDAACGSLLDTLVEKKYPWKLWHHDGYHFEVTHGWDDKIGYTLRTYMIKPTRREAIVAACLEVARKEASHVD